MKMEVLNKIKNFLYNDDIGEPPWDYYFLVNLDEGLYPVYLKKILKYKTGENLPIKKVGKNQWIIDKNKCKTFNQKIQWIKLHGVTDLMRMCTDKVAVRDYVRERIGEEYLKPVLQIIPDDNKKVSCHCEEQPFEGDEAIQKEQSQKAINENFENNRLDCHGSIEPRSDRRTYCSSNVTTYFDQIDFDKLPNAFVMKCNHGCKWQYIIKNKEEFLNVPQLFEVVKRNMTGWLEQSFLPWSGFETQYKNIKPQIIIEELIGNNNKLAQEIEVFCFDGEAKLIKKVHNDIVDKLTMYDENLNEIDFKFNEKEFLVSCVADDTLKQAVELSNELSSEFNFVRVDWLVFENKLYFNELTFTPFSGTIRFDKKWNLKLGNFIDLERSRHGF